MMWKYALPGRRLIEVYAYKSFDCEVYGKSRCLDNPICRFPRGGFFSESSKLSWTQHFPPLLHACRESRNIAWGSYDCCLSRILTFHYDPFQGRNNLRDGKIKLKYNDDKSSQFMTPSQGIIFQRDRYTIFLRSGSNGVRDVLASAFPGDLKTSNIKFLAMDVEMYCENAERESLFERVVNDEDPHFCFGVPPLLPSLEKLALLLECKKEPDWLRADFERRMLEEYTIDPRPHFNILALKQARKDKSDGWYKIIITAEYEAWNCGVQDRKNKLRHRKLCEEEH